MSGYVGKFDISPTAVKFFFLNSSPHIILSSKVGILSKDCLKDTSEQ